MIEISSVFNWELWNGIPYDSQTKRSRCTCTYHICGWLNACIVCCQYGCCSVRNVYLASRPWPTHTHTLMRVRLNNNLMIFPLLELFAGGRTQIHWLIKCFYNELDRQSRKKRSCNKSSRNNWFFHHPFCGYVAITAALFWLRSYAYSHCMITSFNSTFLYCLVNFIHYS